MAVPQLMVAKDLVAKQFDLMQPLYFTLASYPRPFYAALRAVEGGAVFSNKGSLWEEPLLPK